MRLFKDTTKILLAFYFSLLRSSGGDPPGKEEHEKALTLTTQVRGGERDIFKVQTEHLSGHMFLNQKVKELETVIRHSNNYKDVKSQFCIRTIKSQFLAESDLHRDDMIDLLARQRIELEKEPDLIFIQTVTQPLQVCLFASGVIKAALSYFKNKPKVTCHFDATGKLIRAMHFFGKTVYYYACIVQINNQNILLFGLISCQHDQASIGVIFSKFRQHVEGELKWKWPCIGRIVVDCSFAIIHAIMRNWNSTSLQSYLANCYKYCLGQATTKSWADAVIVRLCKSHWTKNSCNNCKTNCITGRRKAFIVEVLMKLMATISFAEFEAIFQNFVLILLSKAKHKFLVTAFEELDLLKDFADKFEEPKVTNLSEEIDEHAFVSSEQYDSTPFHKHCRRIVTFVEEQINCLNLPDPVSDSEDCNPFYCPQFVEEIFFKNHYAATVPLWTSLMDALKSPKGGFTASNGPIEGYFQMEKHDVHKKNAPKTRKVYKDRKRLCHQRGESSSLRNTN